MTLARRAALCLVVLLAACKAPEKPVFEAFDFYYLTKIKLNVATIEIDDGWVPRGSAGHVEYLAPTRPTKAMRLMVEHRLVTGGTAGQAVFRIDDASIILFRGRFEGSFAVHLELLDPEGQPAGMANARVRDSVAARDEEDQSASQVDIEGLMRRMMEKLNVEFEYQVRQALKSQVQTTTPAAPEPEAIDKQDLTTVPPPAADAASDSAPVLAPAPTLSPQPGVLRPPMLLAPPATP